MEFGDLYGATPRRSGRPSHSALGLLTLALKVEAEDLQAVGRIPDNVRGLSDVPDMNGTILLARLSEQRRPRIGLGVPGADISPCGLFPSRGWE